MRIAICIPARGQMEVATGFDLVAMCAYTIKTTKHDIDLFTSAGTLIFDQRNSLVKTALEIKADYLLFVDADMRFPKDTLKILMAHDKDIIGVNATTRSEPVKPTAKNFIVNEDQSVDWLPIYSNVRSGIEKADGIGCGVMLVKTKVFKEMEEPYFYFEQLGNNKILGEDIYFCIKAKDAGFDTWVDHDLSKGIKHIGQYVYGWDNIEIPKD
jgi:cellulose synthase/poly-beta-1,6-N-acetylglucosamine synthase-like glycosyltransferase